MKPPAPRLPRTPRGRLSSERRRESFRRDHAALIEQKLEQLRRGWEVKRDPGVVVNAKWMCDQLRLAYPPWLREVAAKFPVDMGKVSITGIKAGKVILRPARKLTGVSLGRPSDEDDVRAAVENEFARRGRPPGITLPQYAKRFRARHFPGRPEDEAPTWRTVMDYISKRPSLWKKYSP
jgi:hypothetical protein